MQLSQEVFQSLACKLSIYRVCSVNVQLHSSGVYSLPVWLDVQNISTWPQNEYRNRICRRWSDTNKTSYGHTITNIMLDIVDTILFAGKAGICYNICLTYAKLWQYPGLKVSNVTGNSWLLLHSHMKLR